MKKRVIAIILSLVMAASGAGTHPVLAAETSAVETATGQEESESAQNPGDASGDEEAGGETDGATGDVTGDETGQGTGETSGEVSDGEAADPDSPEETPGEESDGEAADLDSTEETSGEESDGEAADPDSTDGASGEDDETEADSSTAADGSTAVDPNEITELVTDESTMKGEAAGTMLGAAEVSGLDADVHSQSEIRQFVRDHLAPVIANTYEEEPSTTVPYSPGVLSDESTEAGFNALNQARYIAGIPADVEYDAGYTAKAQAGALSGVHPFFALKKAGRAFDLDQRGDLPVPGDQVDLPAAGLVAGADHPDALRAQVADIDIGRHIHPSQMSDVHRPVGVGQCRSYCITFVFLVFFAVCHVILFLVTIGDIQVTAYPGGIVLVVVLVNVFFVALNRLVVDVGGLAHHRYPH